MVPEVKATNAYKIYEKSQQRIILHVVQLHGFLLVIEKRPTSKSVSGSRSERLIPTFCKHF